MDARVITSALVITICGFAVPVTGQATPAQAKPAAAGETVLSGCLLDSRADTTTADPQGVIYTLDVAETTAAKPGEPGGGTTRAAAVAKTRYALSTESASGSLDLAKHVGHHVQLTGRIMPRAAGTAGTPGASAKAKPLPGAAHRMFHVSALKMIAATCP